MTIYKSSREEIMAMLKKRQKDGISIKSRCSIEPIRTSEQVQQSLSEIRKKLKAQEQKERTLTEAIFRNGMELPSIETAVYPAMNDGVLACPNEKCIETTHIHPGTITRDDGDIYIPFTCEHCRFTYRLEFTYRNGTISLKWNKSVVENI